MITVIVLHEQHSAIYMMPNRRTVAELMKHWISDTGLKTSLGDMKFLTLDGYTLTDGTFVESIPLSDVDTRCVKALSRKLTEEAATEQTALALDTAAEDIAALRERQLEEERKMKAAGLYVEIHPASDQSASNNGDDDYDDDDDDDDGVEYQAVAATFTRTALQYKQDIALKLKMPLESFRLRKPNNELLHDEVRLMDQGVGHDTLLIVEKQRLITVHIVSRSHSYSKKANVFKDELVADKLLERNIPLEDQRVCYNGCRVSVARETTILDIFGEDCFMTALILDLTVVLREPVVLTRNHRSRRVGVWPEDVVGCLLEIEPEVEPPAPLVDRPINERWAYKSELITDVLFNNMEDSDSKKGSLFYNCCELDPSKTFADLALPPWAIIAHDPLELTFIKEYEFELSVRVPKTATVADTKELLLKKRPALFAEDFQLCGPGRRFMDPVNTPLSNWGLNNGDRCTIDPIRVPHIVLLSRR